jgi:hypothetical protein
MSCVGEDFTHSSLPLSVFRFVSFLLNAYRCVSQICDRFLESQFEFTLSISRKDSQQSAEAEKDGISDEYADTTLSGEDTTFRVKVSRRSLKELWGFHLGEAVPASTSTSAPSPPAYIIAQISEGPLQSALPEVWVNDEILTVNGMLVSGKFKDTADLSAYVRQQVRSLLFR